MLMRTLTSIERKVSFMNITHPWALVWRLALALVLTISLGANAAQQQTFATPEAAVDALAAALEANSDSALIAIFGDDSKDLLLTSDRAAATATRAKALSAMKTLRVLSEPTQD